MKHLERGAALCGIALACASPAVAQVPQHTRIMGFADFSYVMTDREGAAQGFRQGQVVGHIMSELSQRVHFFSEVSATAITGGFRMEVERIGIRYDVRDALKISAGRFHTPITYWNTAYHHGHWLQTSIARPEIIRGGGTFLPIHFVGLQIEGSLPAAGVGYQAGFGNGRTATFTRAGDEGEANFRPAYFAAAHVRPAFIYGLQLGVGTYFDRPTDAAGTAISERAGSVHLVLEGRSPELIAEWARVGHRTDGTGGWRWGSGGYIQGGYRLPGAAEVLVPYARWESVRVPEGDAMVPAGSSYNAWLGGVRLDFTSVTALKVEYRNERSTAGRFSSVIFELAYTFPGAPGEAHAEPMTAGTH